MTLTIGCVLPKRPGCGLAEFRPHMGAFRQAWPTYRITLSWRTFGKSDAMKMERGHVACTEISRSFSLE